MPTHMLVIRGRFCPLSSVEAHVRAEALSRTQEDVFDALRDLGVENPEGRSSLVKGRALAEAKMGTVKWSEDIWRIIIGKMGVILPSARMEMSGETHRPLLVVY